MPEKTELGKEIRMSHGIGTVSESTKNLDLKQKMQRGIVSL